MSLAALADAFFREVAASGEVFAIEHEDEGPETWHLAGGIHARPFFSSRARAVRMLEGPLRRKGRVVVPHLTAEFRDQILPAMRADGLLVGLNWSGMRARGYNLDPDQVLLSLQEASTRRAAG